MATTEELNAVRARGITPVQMVDATGTPAASAPSASTLTTGQSALSTSAAQVIATNAARNYAEVKNTDAAILMYIGMSGALTTANGHLLRPGEAFGFRGYTGPIFMIAASGTPTATFIQW
jgi:hypothetical protein